MTDYKHLLGEEWYEALTDIIHSDYWEYLGDTIARERLLRPIYPEKGSDLFFKAFRTTPISEVKAVVLGQDPYHDPGSYDGFAFSNSPEKRGRVSPSLQNILREVQEDCYPEWKFDTFIADASIVSLERWAKQGVLLINTAHTVAKGVPGSHLGLWKPFTKAVLDILMIEHDKPIVFILWGRNAQKIFNDQVGTYPIKNGLVIESAHPSPFSAYSGFFGSKPFSKTNEFLVKNNVKPIVW